MFPIGISRIAALATLGSFATLTNTAQTRTVVWSSDPTCGFHTKGFTAEDKLNCRMVETPRGPVSVVSVRGVDLSVVFAESGEHIIVAADITNASKGTVSFDSDLWGAAHYRVREDFSSDKAPLLAETSIPSRDLIRQMASGKRLQDSLGDFMSDISMTAEEKEFKRADGSKYRVSVIVPDKEAKVYEQGKSANRAENLTNEQIKIRETALTAKSVQAGASLKGLVYFRKVKKATYVVFSFTVEDTAYVFRLPRRPS